MGYGGYCEEKVVEDYEQECHLKYVLLISGQEVQEHKETLVEVVREGGSSQRAATSRKGRMGANRASAQCCRGRLSSQNNSQVWS